MNSKVLVAKKLTCYYATETEKHAKNVRARVRARKGRKKKRGRSDESVMGRKKLAFKFRIEKEKRVHFSMGS